MSFVSDCDLSGFLTLQCNCKCWLYIMKHGRPIVYFLKCCSLWIFFSNVLCISSVISNYGSNGARKKRPHLAEYCKCRMRERVRLTIACEVWGGHILDGDLLQEGWLLTARVSTDHPGLLQPLTQPGQMTITHIWVGQEVTMKIKGDRARERNH